MAAEYQMAGIDEFKNILAIRFMRLGDVALLLPALARLKDNYPNARLTLLTDERCAPLARLCPSLDEVIGIDRLEMRDGSTLDALKSMSKLVVDIRQRHFDLVVDFLSFRETNLLTWLSGARYRLGMKRYDRAFLKFCFNLPPVLEDKQIHVSEMFQRIASRVSNGLISPPVKRDILVLPAETKEWAKRVSPGSAFLTLYCGAPVPVRRWPGESFARIVDFAVQELGVPVAVVVGPAEGEIAVRIRALCRYPEQLRVFDDLNVQQMAALIARSTLLVSNDTGPMHIGPVFGIPTLGLFSVGYPEHYRPLGERSRFLHANPIEKISVEDVIRSIRGMWTNSS